MKRSEMIKIMKYASATGPSAENMDRYLENILNKIEEAGMMPPPLNHDHFEWDPEDES